jgi:hypothetical protein
MKLTEDEIKYLERIEQERVNECIQHYNDAKQQLKKAENQLFAKLMETIPLGSAIVIADQVFIHSLEYDNHVLKSYPISN